MGSGVRQTIFCGNLAELMHQGPFAPGRRVYSDQRAATFSRRRWSIELHTLNATPLRSRGGTRWVKRPWASRLFGSTSCHTLPASMADRTAHAECNAPPIAGWNVLGKKHPGRRVYSDQRAATLFRRRWPIELHTLNAIPRLQGGTCGVKNTPDVASILINELPRFAGVV